MKTTGLFSYGLLFALLLAGCAEVPVEGEVSDGAAPSTERTSDDTQREPSWDAEVAPESDVSDAAGLAEVEAPVDPVEPSSLEPCEPALTLVPEHLYVLPFRLGVLDPSGGTGAYTFVLEDDTVGTLNPDTGVFLAGDQAGRSTRVFVTDQGCVGVAEATLEVVEPMRVIPAAPEVPPQTAIPFTIEEGSGQSSIELLDNGTGATLSDQEYVAGDVEGSDLLRVLDPATGEEVFVYVDVRQDAALRPTTRWPQVALGESLEFEISGGTGAVDYVISGGVAALEGGQLIGLKAGRGSLSVEDRIAGLTLSIPVGVSAPRSSEGNRSGDLSDSSVLAASDLDGDGFDELLVGIGEVDYSAHNSGALYLYRGTEEGVELAPSHIYATDDKDVRAGTSVAVGDFDGDGRPDLAVGVLRADPGVNDGGEVRIYKGTAEGMPSETTFSSLGGPFSGDMLGRSLAACDFNADGVDDLVATAREGENRALLKPFQDQGAIHLYLGQEGEGLPTSANQILFGHALVEGELVQRERLRVGLAAAAGDFDGDGACDVVVSTIDWSFDEEKPNRQDGGVFLYRGVHAEAGDEGGLESTPSRVWGAQNEAASGTHFGSKLLLSDWNGDGLADLVVSQARYKDPSQGGNSHGAVNLFYGEQLSNQPPTTVIVPDEADLRFVGNGSNTTFGGALNLGDIDQDGQPELIVGAPRELNEQGVRSGSVHFYTAVDAESAPAHTVVFGENATEFFGTGVAVTSGVLASMASRDDSFGLNVGRPYLVSPEGRTGLELPGVGTGDAFGEALALVGDLTGDGIEDLAIGVPNEDIEDLGANAGVTMIYRGTSEGIETEPAAVLKGFRTHSEGDRFGAGVFAMGDIDGDGRADLGVLSAVEELPGSGAFGDELYNDGPCEFGAAGVGALYIFRGTDQGVPEAEPAFIVYGLKQGARLDSVSAGLDVNGDGRGDIIAGNPAYDVPAPDELDEEGELVPVNNQGAVAVYFGQPSAGNGTTVVLCAPSAVIPGGQNNGRLGHQVVSMGDVDGDGCDDFAASALQEEYTALAEGAVHFVRGWGGAGCPPEPTVSVVAPGLQSVFSGARMAGGEDVDGDGVPDVVIGNSGFSADLVQQGAIWLISGAYLSGLPAFAPGAWELGDVQPMWPVGVSAQLYRALGTGERERFGASIDLLPGAGPQGAAQVVVGVSHGAASGAYSGGGAVVLDFVGGDEGFSSQPAMLFGGEATRVQSLLGFVVSAGTVGQRRLVVVGGPGSSSVSVDNGAAYILDLTP